MKKDGVDSQFQCTVSSIQRFTVFQFVMEAEDVVGITGRRPVLSSFGLLKSPTSLPNDYRNSSSVGAHHKTPT